MNPEVTSPVYLTAAFYKFVDLPDFAELKPPLLAFCEAHHVKGMVLLAREGINSTIAGAPSDVQAVLEYLRRDPRLADLEHKASYADKPPFYRMKVRLKKEIVTMGVPGVDPAHLQGPSIRTYKLFLSCRNGRKKRVNCKSAMDASRGWRCFAQVASAAKNRPH